MNPVAPSLIGLILLMGISSYLAIHNFWLWLGRREETLNLQITGWCVTSWLYTLSRYLQYTATEPPSAIFNMRLSIGLYFLLTLILVSICRQLAMIQSSRPIALALLAAHVGLLVWHGSTSALVADQTMPLTDWFGHSFPGLVPGQFFLLLAPFTFALLLYAFIPIAQTCRLKLGTWRLILTGLGVYAGVSVYDWLIAIGWTHPPFLSEYGFAAIALGLSYLQIQRGQRLTSNLEKMIVARTREIEEKNHLLSQTLAQAQAAARAKNEFLTNMSHEIRTPMNGVMGMTEVLMDMNLSLEQRDCAQTIQSSSNELLAVINDILDFSTAAAGKLELRRVAFDLRTQVEEVVDLFAELAYRKGLELTCFIDPQVSSAMYGDPDRLCQILSNLMGNAIKFTQRGEIILEVSTVEFRGSRSAYQAEINASLPERCQIYFSVRDTGIGISLEKQRIIFDAFAQADASMTRQFSGTGLGLSISKQLVDLMGGQMSFESQPGKGSIFRFDVPLQRIMVEAETRPLSPTMLRSWRVLIVDDNATSCQFLQTQLAGWQIQSHMAQNGQQALRMLREAVARRQPYNVLILDRQMPEMDGPAVARTIKADPHLASTQIILLTPLNLRHRTSEIEEIEFVACLTKPVRQSRLYDSLLRILHASPTEKGTSTSQSSTLPQAHRLQPFEPTSSVIPERGWGIAEALSHPAEVPPPTPEIVSRILVVDDNPVNQKVAIRMLKKSGYQVTLANDGQEALTKLETAPFDLVLMDVQMPQMDGLEATLAIRQKEQITGNHIPIIAMTAHAMQGDREKCLAVGMDDYISKPVKGDALEALLKQWLQPHEQTLMGTQP